MSALSTLHLHTLDSQLAALVKMCALVCVCVRVRLRVPYYRGQVDVGGGGGGNCAVDVERIEQQGASSVTVAVN